MFKPKSIFLEQTYQNLGSFKLSSFRKKIKKLQKRINNIFHTCRIFFLGGGGGGKGGV